MKENKFIVQLTALIYDSDAMKNKQINVDGSQFTCLDFIDETQKWNNGLQAAVYRANHDADTLYLIIRGADVGLGRRIFQWTKADERFIPKSNAENEWLTSFQDWFYTSLLGGLGLVPLYQFDSLWLFYRKIREEHPNAIILVAGHSLGGLLAQRLYILVGDIQKCVTFAALSPWWTFPTGAQKLLKSRNFFKDDEQLINYYSAHDPFRIFPFFRRNIGQQKNVLLQPFQSRTNVIATFLERVYWAHVPNYYIYDKKGDIRLSEESSSLERLYAWLNRSCSYHSRMNLTLIFSSLFLATLLTLLFFYGASYLQSLFQLGSLSQSAILPILFYLLPILYLLPVLYVESNWKYIFLAVDLLIGWLVFPWVFLLLLLPIVRAIADPK